MMCTTSDLSSASCITGATCQAKGEGNTSHLHWLQGGKGQHLKSNHHCHIPTCAPSH